MRRAIWRCSTRTRPNPYPNWREVGKSLLLPRQQGTVCRKKCLMLRPNRTEWRSALPLVSWPSRPSFRNAGVRSPRTHGWLLLERRGVVGEDRSLRRIALEVLTGLDVGILRDALVEPHDLLGDRPQHPAHIHGCLPEVPAFARIVEQVMHDGQLDVGDRIVDAVGLAENDLEVLPLDGHQSAVQTEVEDRFAPGFFALAQQMIGDVDTIDRPVSGNAFRFASEAGQGRQPVYRADHLLAHPACRDVPG